MVQLRCVDRFEPSWGGHIQGLMASADAREVRDVLRDSHAEVLRGGPLSGVE